MSLGTLLVLRLLHIVLGVFWVGAVVFIGFFLIPSIRATGAAGGAVMQRLTSRQMPLWLMGASILTVLSGFGSSAWRASGPGRTFGLGAVLALVAIVIGMAVNSRAAKQLGDLAARLQAAGRPPSPDEAVTMQRLQDRLAKGAVLAAILLLLATAAMAAARYT
jgi:hypothetical protein